MKQADPYGYHKPTEAQTATVNSISYRDLSP